MGISREYGEFDNFIRYRRRFDCTDTDDCVGFDASVLGVTLGCGSYVINSFLSPKWRKAGREHLWGVIGSVIVLGDGRIVIKHRGGASGTFLTSDLNSIVRLIVKVYELLRWAQEFAPGLVLTNALLDEMVLVDVFGDDCATSVRWNPAINFTPETYSIENRARWSYELNIVVESDGVYGPWGMQHSFLSCKAKFDKDANLFVPLSTRGSKVLYGALYCEMQGAELVAYMHEVMVIFAYDDVYRPWAEKLFDELSPGSRRASLSYRQRFHHGVAR